MLTWTRGGPGVARCKAGQTRRGEGEGEGTALLYCLRGHRRRQHAEKEGEGEKGVAASTTSTTGQRFKFRGQSSPLLDFLDLIGQHESNFQKPSYPMNRLPGYVVTV